jgi:hypothetical protein
MNKVLPLAAGCLLISAQALAGSIYRCDTPEGVEFSQSPCAKDAVRLDRGAPRTGLESATVGPSPPAEVVDIGGIGALGDGSKEAIIERLGEPPARYTIDGTEHWFYPNATDASADEPVFAEFLIENGRMFQITWLPADVMQRSVASARRLAGWVQPERISDKNFDVSDTDIVGESKSQVTGKFGRPDAKKVFDARSRSRPAARRR